MALVASLAAWDEPSTSQTGAKRYQALYDALSLARSYLLPRDMTNNRSVGRLGLDHALRLIGNEGRLEELLADYMDAVENRFYLVKREIQRFTNRLQETSAVSLAPQTDPIIMEMLDRLAIWQRAWGFPLKVFNDSKIISTYTQTFHLHLHSTLPSTFPFHLRTYLTNSLLAHTDSPSPTKASPHLSRLGILPRYSAILGKVAYEEIERIAKDEAGKGWEGRRLGPARARVGEGVAGWLSGLFDGNEAAQMGLKTMYSRFDYHLCKCFFDIRTDELFDIIVDYPESLSALEDLKECLFKVDQRGVLVEKLKAANVKRLLHPGAETKDLLTQYISTIRCLRILDPPGVLLHKIAGPIRKHLRERGDTIKCIVGVLVEGEELGLGDQNDNTGGAGLGVYGDEEGGEGVEDFGDPKWEPEPVDAAPEFRSGKSSDIISTLVSIYETRDVIFKELQVLLASRLLAVKNYDAVKEIRTIELLKIRFGEAALGPCDVMLKDMADSKRIDDHVHGDIKSVVHPLVISRMFWPSVGGSSLHLTPKLEAAQQTYSTAFHKFKPDKQLRFHQSLGSTHIRLELNDRAVEVEATPLQACIIELFEERGGEGWELGDLAERLGVGKGVVRRGVGWWVEKGVLGEVGGRFRVME